MGTNMGEGAREKVHTVKEKMKTMQICRRQVRGVIERRLSQMMLIGNQKIRRQAMD